MSILARLPASFHPKMLPTLLRPAVAALLCMCLWIGTAAAESAEADPPRPINAATLRQVALMIDPTIDALRYAEDHLRNEEPHRLATVAHDPDATRAVIDTKLAELREAASWVGKAPVLRLSAPGQVYLTTEGKLAISMPTAFGTLGFEAPWLGSPRATPGSYSVILANTDLLERWSLDAAESERLRKRIEVLGPQSGFVDVDIRLHRITQNWIYHASIVEAVWYSDSSRSRRIGEVRERRNGERLSRQGWLAEGVSLEKVPEHSFEMAEERILEIPLYGAGMLVNCKDQKRELKHRVVVCERKGEHLGEFSGPAKVRIVGGRIVEIAVYGNGRKAGDADIENLWRFLNTRLHSREVPQLKKAMRWEQSRATLGFHPERLSSGDTKNPVMWAKATSYLEFTDANPENRFVP